MTEEPNLAGEIARLAEIVLQEGLSDRFRNVAKISASSFDEEDLDDLKYYLHNPPPESKLFKPADHGYGGWLSACQFSAFELVVNMGEPALPWLRRLAWGEYDWTQGNAIEILIRLAARGIQSEQIIAEVAQKFVTLEHEAQLYVIEPLIPLAANDNDLKAIVERLNQSSAFAKAYKEVTQS